MSGVATGQVRTVDAANLRRVMGMYLFALVAISLTLGVLHVLFGDVNVGGTRWFDLDKERNIATWFTGFLFFLFGSSAAVAFYWETQINRTAKGQPFRLPLLWLGVAVVGWWMSLDEITILHENLFWREVRLASNERSDAWKYLTQWQVLFGPAILLALSYMVVFFTNRFSASPAARRGAFTGLGCWTIALVLEGVRGTVRQVSSTWYEGSVVLEESFEMLGAVFLLSAIVGYVLDVTFDFTAERRERLRLAGGFLSPRALAGLGATFVVLVIGAGMAWAMAQRQAAAGDPVPGLFRRAVASGGQSQKPPLRAPELPPVDSSTIWFEDVAAARLPVVDDVVWGGWAAAALFGGKTPAGAAVLTQDAAPRIAFLSVSDGGRATVFQGQGQGVTAALNDARARSGLAAADLRSAWVRLDVVDTVEAEDRIDFRPPLSMEPGIHGLAFGRRAGIAILPVELSANYLVNSDLAIRPRAMLAWMEARDPVSAARFAQMLQPRVVNPYRFFTTRSLFFEAGRPVPLFRSHRDFTALTPGQLLDSARSAGDYLVSSVSVDGRFIYSYTPSLDETDSRYNMLRHAGTAYSMVELFQVTGDDRVIDAARRAFDFLADNLQPCPESVEGTSCVIDGGDSVKLGGNALAAVAIAKYTEVTGDTKYRHLLAPLVKWIQSVQDDSGQFVVHKQAFPGGQISGFVSDYYPGEAILALCRTFDEIGDSSLIDTAAAAALWLIDVRDAGLAVADLNHDHWLLYALNELYRHRPDEKFLVHSRRIAEAIVTAQNRQPEFPDWHGSYYKPPRSTPTAIRSEGLAAAWELLRDFGKPGENEPILDAIRLGVRFQLRTQLRPEQTMFYRNPQRTLGAFTRSLTEDEIRIDYVQHNISALLGLRRIMLDGQDADDEEED